MPKREDRSSGSESGALRKRKRTVEDSALPSTELVDTHLDPAADGKSYVQMVYRKKENHPGFGPGYFGGPVALGDDFDTGRDDLLSVCGTMLRTLDEHNVEAIQNEEVETEVDDVGETSLRKLLDGLRRDGLTGQYLEMGVTRYCIQKAKEIKDSIDSWMSKDDSEKWTGEYNRIPKSERESFVATWNNASSVLNSTFALSKSCADLPEAYEETPVYLRQIEPQQVGESCLHPILGPQEKGSLLALTTHAPASTASSASE